ncbi:cytochrome P450 CYP72A219-like [Bidens hawaiensis]|uniref:cytochrome P450 CYP72A219-like n=1 Tax=Bidens hawaiensis TaxID=980011 RepID=UPI00404961CB
METTTSFCVLGVASIFLFCIWRILNWVWFKPKKIEKFLRDQGLKGTPYKFLYGDLKEMTQMTNEAKSKPMNLTHNIAPRVLPFFHKSITTHGKNCFTWIGPMPVLHIHDLSMIRELLANYNKFQKPRGVNPLTKLLVRGLLTTEGEQWVKHRKIIKPAFHMEKLKCMVPAFYASCSDMMEKLENAVNMESSCEVDVWPHIQTFSSDVISRTAFGSSFEEGRKIFELQREQSELIRKAISTVYIPGSRFLPTKNNKRMKQIHQQVRDSISSIINKRVVAMKAGEASPDDLLGILLDSSNEEIKQHGNRDFGLSADEIIEECKLFYFAGQETTANMLVWTTILLGRHTEWQTRAREEVLHVFGDKKPSVDGLSHLKVINCIFNEVLRLYTPIVFLRRLIHEETKLGDLTLPEGTIVQLNMLILHHDKDMWGEDVNEFKPERFSEGISKVTTGQAAYYPFGGGPRICIGQNFAILEVKMALAMILQRFSFELSPSYSHAPHTMLTLQPQFGAHLILHKI